LHCSYSVPHSHTSTLFPYTTLFRSDDGNPALHEAADHLEKDFDLVRGEDGGRLVHDDNVGFAGNGLRDFDHLLLTHAEVAHARRDRKSTRLNSSHVKISYAVFCLKK